MTKINQKNSGLTAAEMELATFYLDDLLLAVDIHRVQEINRHLEFTPVPHAPPFVLGVVNLRGDVVTVVDLRTLLGLGRQDLTLQTRNVIVKSQGEQIGMLVDRVADVVRVSQNELDEPPANVSGVDGRFFKYIYKLENKLLIILDVDAVIDVKESCQSVL
ncbi:MAG: chemotaxis protein CheW [Pirellulales bacterium]|nr:chemotaxis protein CheW [Pirellulales bacterium]